MIKKLKMLYNNYYPLLYRKKKLEEGKYIFLPNRVYEKYLLSMKSINSNKRFLEKLNPNDEFVDDIEIFNEYAILCEIEFNGRIIKFKGKLDNFTIDHNCKNYIK